MVGDIIEDARQYQVICQFVQRWRGVKHDQARDVDVDVCIIERADLAEDVACNEQEGCPRENACDFPAFVVTMEN